jgi:hypothetical protein
MALHIHLQSQQLMQMETLLPLHLLTQQRLLSQLLVSGLAELTKIIAVVQQHISLTLLLKHTVLLHL